MSNTATIPVPLTITVDLDAWMQTYSLGTPEAAEKDARDYVPSLVAEYLSKLPHLHSALLELRP
jgi:hypothetical protein